MNIVDLHTHTTASDGTLSPKELIDYAIEKGLQAVAISDHDTIDGLEAAFTYIHSQEFLTKHPNSSAFELIPAIEFSSSLDGYEGDLHILGYYFDYESKELQKELASLLADRNSRNLQMIEQINKLDLGFQLDYETISSYAPDRVITRAHFAKYLAENGYYTSKEEVFAKLLGNGMPGYVPRKNVTAKTAIELIKKYNGIAVLAHPFLYHLDTNGLYSLLDLLKSYGLDGVETYYSLNTSSQTEYMKKMAKRFDLIMTGGSDYHGTNKKDLDLSIGYGNLQIPDEVYTTLHSYKFT